jgi:hypothetical protein
MTPGGCKAVVTLFTSFVPLTITKHVNSIRSHEWRLSIACSLRETRNLRHRRAPLPLCRKDSPPLQYRRGITRVDREAMFCLMVHCLLTVSDILPSCFALLPSVAINEWHQKNSMASVCKRTIPTERPLLVSEVSANFLRIEGAMWSA